MVQARLAKCLAMAFVAIAFCALAGVDCSDKLPVELGKWNSNFAEAKALSERYHIPMVCFWAGADCDTCKNVEAAVQTDEFLEWQADRKLVMVYNKGTSGEMHDFAQNASGLFPYLCVYWVKDDGTAQTNRFSGTTRGDAKWPVTGRNIAEHFILSVESFISDYQPSPNYGGDFFCGDKGEEDQFEAVPAATEFITVPLKRIRASVPFAATNYLEVVYPRNIGVATNVVPWAEGDETVYSKVVFPVDKPILTAENVELRLIDAMGQFVTNRFIRFIDEPENTPKNPRWFGERDASTLAWGEWTVDLDAATNKAAAAEGAAWTLVGIVGSLWCPDCIRSDEFFLTQPEFKNWARDNQVALVSVDIPNLGRNLAPQLFSYDSGTTARSGAGYLSRHMVEPAEAAAVSERNAFLAREYFHRPEDTNANRTGVPIFVLLRKDGSIASRFTRLASVSPVDTSNNAAYVKRLTEMLETAGEADEIANNDVTTCGTVLPLDTPSSERVLTHADNLDTMELGGVTTGASVRVTARRTGARNSTVTLSVVQLLGGQKTTLATETGPLDGLSVAAMLTAPGARHFAQISGSVTGDFTAETMESTVTPYALSSSMELVPLETSVTFTPPAGMAAVKMAVDANNLYRFAGFPAGALDAAFAPVLGSVSGLYSVRGESGVVELAVDGPVSYQIWKPGEVGFVTEDMEVSEKTDVVSLVVARFGGTSGAAAAAVAVSGISDGRVELGTFDEAGRFVAGAPTLAWAEGEDGERAFALRVIDDIVATGDETAVLTLTATEAAPIAAGAETCRVKVLEDDEPVPGTIAIVGTEPAVARNATIYAPAGGSVAIDVRRLVGAQGLATATLTAKLNGIATNLFDRSVLVWRDRCGSDEELQTATLAVPADAVGEKIAISLAVEGAELDSASKSLTVLVVDPTGPKFADGETVSLSARSRVTFAARLAVTNTFGGKVTVRKLSGSLPSGLKAAYSAKDGAMVVSGTPSKPGVSAVVYQVSETRDGRTCAGATMTLEITVGDTAETFPAITKSRTFKDLMLVVPEHQRLAGLLSLTVSSAGRASAKYACSVGTVAFNASGWVADEENGTLTMRLLSSRVAYENYSVRLTQFAGGALKVEVYDPDYPTVWLETTADASLAWGVGNSAAAWAGRYTVAMPAFAYKALSNVSNAYDVAASGTPTFAVRMFSAADKRSGRMTWAGVLANGQSVSGNAILTSQGTVACLPMLKKTSKDFFTAVLSIEADAAGNFERSHNHRAITAPGDVRPWWKHTERADMGVFGWTYDVYGSYFDPDENLDECLLKTGVSPLTSFMVATADLAESPTRGVPGEVAPAAVAADGDKLIGPDVNLTYSRSTGVVKGSFKVPFSKRPVTAQWRGVILPGFTGCGCKEGEPDPLPFVMGACWFSDTFTYEDPDALVLTVRKLTLKRGCAVTAETTAVVE